MRRRLFRLAAFFWLLRMSRRTAAEAWEDSDTVTAYYRGRIDPRGAVEQYLWFAWY